MAMREAFFPDSVVMGGAAGGGSDVDMDVAAAGAALLRAPPQASGRAAPRASSQFAQASAAPGRPVLHNWRQAAAPPITAATSKPRAPFGPDACRP